MQIHEFLASLLLLHTVHNAQGSNYTLVNIDGFKDLWCPDVCFVGMSDKKSVHCCACDSIPDYLLPQNAGNLVNVHVEIYNVQRNSYDIIAPKSFYSTNTTYQFIYTRNGLRNFPQNFCDLQLVKIDVSYNLFNEIGNISCQLELDTLLMSNNRITRISNETFANLTKLRYVDLSFNMIIEMDYNVFQSSEIFTLLMKGNQMTKLDVVNTLKINKTACMTDFANNKKFIKITNEGNYLAFKDIPEESICNNINMSNNSYNQHPLLSLVHDKEIRSLLKIMPCGEITFFGTGYYCDCTLGDLFNLGLPGVQRLVKKEHQNNFCSGPDQLQNISIEDVYNNETMRDLMTCDIVDFCPKNGNCKCTCTSQPNRHALIVDCSNQSCIDFPEVVPETRHQIILNMSQNFIGNIHANRTYFPKVKILDLKKNSVTNIKEDISSLTSATDVIICDHELLNLPKAIQLLDPNIFHFCNNGIPCTCDNRWIGQWRSVKNASRTYPLKLECSNLKSFLFEDDLEDLLVCERIGLETIFGVTASIVLFSLIVLLCYCFRYEILLGRWLLKAKSVTQKKWEIDVYVSFDEDNDEIRSFILVNIEFFFRKKKMTTYIQCRDAWVGYPEEDNVRTNMLKCKYALIVQTKGMYTTVGRHHTRRFEYGLALDLMMAGKLAKIFIIKFDRQVDRFMVSKTKALQRLGLTFDICDRKRSLFDVLMQVFNEPIIVNSKHKFRRGIQIKSHLLKKDLETTDYTVDDQDRN